MKSKKFRIKSGMHLVYDGQAVNFHIKDPDTGVTTQYAKGQHLEDGSPVTSYLYAYMEKSHCLRHQREMILEFLGEK